MRPIGFVFSPEGFAEQPLLSLDTTDKDDEHQDGDHDADPRPERQRPSEHGDQETEIAWVANDPIKPLGDQPVIGLDRDQAAEAPTEYEDGRETQNATNDVKEKSEPAHAIAAEGEKVDPVGIGGQVGIEDAEDPQGGDDPAIGAIFPDP